MKLKLKRGESVMNTTEYLKLQKEKYEYRQYIKKIIKEDLNSSNSTIKKLEQFKKELQKLKEGSIN